MKKKRKKRAPYDYTMSEAALEQRRAAGNVPSKKRIRTARENGRLGGRPGNPEIKRIMEKLGVSRQRAWQIVNQK